MTNDEGKMNETSEGSRTPLMKRVACQPLGVEQHIRAKTGIQCTAPTCCLMISTVKPLYSSTTVHFSTATLFAAASRRRCWSSSGAAMTRRYYNKIRVH